MEIRQDFRNENTIDIYENWKAAFIVDIDQARAKQKYNLCSYRRIPLATHQMILKILLSPLSIRNDQKQDSKENLNGFCLRTTLYTEESNKGW